MVFAFLSEGGLPPIWIFIALGGIIHYGGLVVYRIWFHPLAKFPGPKIAALTYWYESYYDLIRNGGAQYPRRIREMYARYGQVVRINPDGTLGIYFAYCFPPFL